MVAILRNHDSENRLVTIKFITETSLICLISDHSAIFVNIAGTYTAVASIIAHQSILHRNNTSNNSSKHEDMTSQVSSLDEITSTSQEERNMEIIILAITIISQWILCFYFIYHIFTYRGQRLKYHILMIVITLPSYFILSSYLTIHERAYALFGLSMYALGAIIFGNTD